MRAYFVLCLVGLYWVARDPFFLVLLAIVLVGMGLTLASYLIDLKQRAAVAP